MQTFPAINFPVQFWAQVGEAKKDMQNTNATLIDIVPARFKLTTKLNTHFGYKMLLPLKIGIFRD